MNVFTLVHRLAARVRKDDKGAAMAEYGLLAVGIAVAVAARDFINREEEDRRALAHTRTISSAMGGGADIRRSPLK
jgi:hypothetical protein